MSQWYAGREWMIAGLAVAGTAAVVSGVQLNTMRDQVRELESQPPDSVFVFMAPDTVATFDTVVISDVDTVEVPVEVEVVRTVTDWKLVSQREDSIHVLLHQNSMLEMQRNSSAASYMKLQEETDRALREMRAEMREEAALAAKLYKEKRPSWLDAAVIGVWSAGLGYILGHVDGGTKNFTSVSPSYDGVY